MILQLRHSGMAGQEVWPGRLAHRHCSGKIYPLPFCQVCKGNNGADCRCRGNGCTSASGALRAKADVQRCRWRRAQKVADGKSSIEDKNVIVLTVSRSISTSTCCCTMWRTGRPHSISEGTAVNRYQGRETEYSGAVLSHLLFTKGSPLVLARSGRLDYVRGHRSLHTLYILCKMAIYTSTVPSLTDLR